MSRLTVTALVLLGSTAVAAEIDHNDFKVGLVGELREGWYLPAVASVIDEKTMLVNLVKKTARSERLDVVVVEVSTKDVADGSLVDMSGTWKITGTKKLKDKTHFVFEKFKEPPVDKEKVAKDAADRAAREKEAKEAERRDRAIFAAAAAIPGEARKIAEKEFPPNSSADVQEQIRAAADRQRAEKKALARLRDDLAKRHGITSADLARIEEKGKREGWETRPGKE